MGDLVHSPSGSVLPVASEWQTMVSMSKALFESGMLPLHIKTPQAALAIIQKGVELGIQPMYALSNILCIQGRPTANSELMLALIYRDHGDGAIEFIESTAQICKVSYKRRSWPHRREYAFSIVDARAAGLAESPNWKKYPAALLRARCVSSVARMAFPDSIGGMYTAEEIGAEKAGHGAVTAYECDPETGEIIEDAVFKLAEEAADPDIALSPSPAPAPANSSEPSMLPVADWKTSAEADRKVRQAMKAKGFDGKEINDHIKSFVTSSAPEARIEEYRLLESSINSADIVPDSKESS